MEDTFVLKIQLGEDAMQSGGDVADALRATADRIDTRREGSFEPNRYGYVFDLNGNSVGSWELQ